MQLRHLYDAEDIKWLLDASSICVHWGQLNLYKVSIYPIFTHPKLGNKINKEAGMLNKEAGTLSKKNSFTGIFHRFHQQMQNRIVG